MAYVAVKGGREAIENAARAFRFEQVKGESSPLAVEQIREQLSLAVDRVMGEGALYAPDFAALAIKQTSGDLLEASFMLRAFCTTQPRLGYSLPQSAAEMRVIRRISAAFKEIPGGQILGPTGDYLLRLLNFDLATEDDAGHRQVRERLLAEIPSAEPLPESFPKIVEMLHREGLLMREDNSRKQQDIFDVTREALSFPASRSAALQSMARAETGGLLALAYSNMRGFGMVHPTVGELRVGYMPVRVMNPYTESPELVGEVKVTEAEIISECREGSGEKPRFTLGYGLCFGHNETKAISMAVLDRSTLAAEPSTPSEDQEFVLLHTDGIEAVGFCNHFKLPHYVTFQSALDRLRKSQEEKE
jgi:alpha-D-ribose 1-methylphosphonate 5-triphosphate synthase subunit PhnI